MLFCHLIHMYPSSHVHIIKYVKFNRSLSGNLFYSRVKIISWISWENHNLVTLFIHQKLCYIVVFLKYFIYHIYISIYDDAPKKDLTAEQGQLSRLVFVIASNPKWNTVLFNSSSWLAPLLPFYLYRFISCMSHTNVGTLGNINHRLF